MYNTTLNMKKVVWKILAALICLLTARCEAAVKCPNKILNMANPLDYCSEQRIRDMLTIGELCILRTEQVRPTQVAVGKIAVRCAVRSIEKKNVTELYKYLYKQQVPTIVGPYGNFYVTDKHHLSSAMFDANLNLTNAMENRVVIACINDDFRNRTDLPGFWKYLNSTGNAYLRDEYGNWLDPLTEIPRGLKDLRDDPYRTLSRWVRNSHGFVKCGSEKIAVPQCDKGDAPFFLEFFWANAFREKLSSPKDPSLPPYIHPVLDNFIYKVNFQTQAESLKLLFEEAMRFATDSSESIHMPGFNFSPDLLKPTPIKIDDFGCDDKDIA